MWKLINTVVISLALLFLPWLAFELPGLPFLPRKNNKAPFSSSEICEELEIHYKGPAPEVISRQISHATELANNGNITGALEEFSKLESVNTHSGPSVNLIEQSPKLQRNIELLRGIISP